MSQIQVPAQITARLREERDESHVVVRVPGTHGGLPVDHYLNLVEARRLCRELHQALMASGQEGELLWTKVSDGLPPYDETERVLIYTEDSEFAGEQFFDVKAIGFHGPEEDRPEVIEHATHWMPRPFPRG